MSYKTLVTCESQNLGVMIGILGNLSHEEISLVHNTCNELYEKLKLSQYLNNPDIIARHRHQIESLIGCFNSHKYSYSQEIPNEYTKYGASWLLVSTTIGPIKIGWRKRVISIDWTHTQKDNAEILFPGEDVTKYGKVIHAWSYEKATEYLSKLLE